LRTIIVKKLFLQFAFAFVLIATNSGCGEKATKLPEGAKTNSATAPATTSGSYDDHLMQANSLFKKGELGDALAEAQTAAKLDPKRYEAPTAAALILSAAKKTAAAKAALDGALKLAPADQQERIQAIAKLISETDTKTEPSKPVVATPPPAKLSGATKRQLNVLGLIIEDADKAKTDAERKKILREFLVKSTDFIQENLLQTNIWLLRAIAAMELDFPNEGWVAGQQLTKLGLENSEDPKVQKVFAQLERNGWLKDHAIRKDLKFDETENLATQGDSSAEWALGFRSFLGTRELGTRDYSKAFYWFKKSAETGNTDAQRSLGLCYQYGLGVSKDEFQAASYYKKVLELGLKTTQNDLAWMLATSTNEKIRDGKTAVCLASNIWESGQSSDHHTFKPKELDVLAAAFAEVGNFESAIKYEKLALDLGRRDSFPMDMCKEHLLSFERNEPIREILPDIRLLPSMSGGFQGDFQMSALNISTHQIYFSSYDAIQLVLRKDDDHFKVGSIQLGSPSWLSGIANGYVRIDSQKFEISVRALSKDEIEYQMPFDGYTNTWIKLSRSSNVQKLEANH
jgi:TPR repeat protein